MKNLITRLDWDSAFFGYEVGRVLLEEINFNSKKFEKEAKDYKLVYLYSKFDIKSKIVKLVDRKVTYTQKINTAIFYRFKDITIRPFVSGKDNLDNLISLGITSGLHSRFNIDTSFVNNEFENLYKEWVLNSVNFKNAFSVLIATNIKNEILGFITITKINRITSGIGLIAIDESARGKGIATGLLYKAIEISVKNKFEQIEVVTQQGNQPAVNLYIKTNFKEKEIINIYHYWNDTI